MKTMKIFQVIPLLATGGAEKFTIDLSNELAHLGHEVVLVTLFDKCKISTLESYVDNKHVRRISLHKKPGFDPNCFINILKLIRKEKPNVVHAHVGAIKYMTLATTFYHKCKYIATIHSEAKREAGKGIELLSRRYMFKLKLMTPVTISNESELSFKKFYGFSGYIIPNGCSSYESVDLDSHKYKENIDFLFVHAGRLQKVKNQITLVKAFKHLLDEGERVRLLIMGRKEDPEVYDSLKSFFNDSIEYLGEQRNSRSFMNEADAFCLSSSMEGMPISIIEAFSVGCIPIVTPVGGCVNMVQNGINGIIADGICEDDYYKALKKYISLDPIKKESMKRCAIETFNKMYSITTSAKKYIELYNK